MTYSTHWLAQHAVNWPLASNAPEDQLTTHAGTLCPFGDSQSLSVVGLAVIVGAVVALLFIGCPAAISGLVVPVVVREAVEAVLSGRTPTNVGKKVFKGVPPTFTNGNSSSAITVEVIDRRIEAAGKHRRPRAIFWSSASAFLGSVRGHVASLLTAAGLTRAPSEALAVNLLFGSTRTTTPPMVYEDSAGGSDASRMLYYGPLSERAAGQIHKGRHISETDTSVRWLLA